MKGAFDRLISRQDMAEERISELKDLSQKTPKPEKQRLKKKNKKISNGQRCDIHVMRIPEGEEKEKGTEEMFETIINNFPQVNVRHQTTDPGSSLNTT